MAIAVIESRGRVSRVVTHWKMYPYPDANGAAASQASGSGLVVLDSDAARSSALVLWQWARRSVLCTWSRRRRTSLMARVMSAVVLRFSRNTRVRVASIVTLSPGARVPRD